MHFNESVWARMGHVTSFPTGSLPSTLEPVMESNNPCCCSEDMAFERALGQLNKGLWLLQHVQATETDLEFRAALFFKHLKTTT